MYMTDTKELRMYGIDAAEKPARACDERVTRYTQLRLWADQACH